MLKTFFFVSAIAISSSAFAATFSKSEQADYMKECTGTDQALKDYCACTLTELQKRFSITEYRALGALSEKQLKDHAAFNEAMAACSDKVE